jgi:acyl-CoA reductase-like NAD-dependent aldehyde dehydrogenase
MPIPDDVDRAAQEAAAAAAAWAASSGTRRAHLLEALAATLERNRPGLVALADEETHLGAARLNGELDRTCFQLRAFASFSAGGAAFTSLDEPAVAGPPPAGHPRLTRVRVPLGPVAMFAASNFPFAFSVLGGDTASALAAGCPVVVKVHPGHPRLSEAVHALAADALAQLDLPSGLIGRVVDPRHEAGVALVRHPAIRAAAFTGSVRGGLALEAHARDRRPPIPFFGELGSVNPVVVLPGADTAEAARQLAASITLGSGQFCTSPGLAILQAGAEGDGFVRALSAALSEAALHPMLFPAIEAGFRGGVQRLAETPGVRLHLRPFEGLAPCLAETDAASFAREPSLREEIFGPAILVVRAPDPAGMVDVLDAVDGSLTVTLWGVDSDTPLHRRLVRSAQAKAGRVLFAGVPTGVAVTAAQHHGGPWPASTQPQSTSVGLAACDRFLRPVALQDAPAWLLARAGVPV